jgi:DNA recombination-dependent growth factor C
MSLLKGALGLSRYKVEGNLPSDFWSWLNHRILQNIFMDIENSAVSKSSGWVSAHDYFDVSFAFDTYNFNPYVVLGLRQDKRTVSSALVRKYHRLEINRRRKAQPEAILSKADREMLKENARLQLLARIPPQTTTWEMCWHTGRGEVWFTTASRSLLEVSLELFQKSFNPLFLTPRLPWLMAQEMLPNQDGLSRLTPLSPE